MFTCSYIKSSSADHRRPIDITTDHIILQSQTTKNYHRPKAVGL